MENGKAVVHNAVGRIMGNHQLVIITRLLQLVETMQSIDELFAWLSDMMVQRMDVQVVQFWARQAYVNGDVSCELRTTVCQSTSVPQQIVINQPLADIVERLLSNQQSVAPQPVENVFSQYHSNLLMRYNLNYWTCHVMSNSLLLPPVRNHLLYEKVATPLTLGVAVFLQHKPSSRLLPTLDHILEHVIPIARSHGLLKVPSLLEQEAHLSESQYRGKRPTLTEFIPYRTPVMNTTKYALTGEPIIDKDAQHLYLDIDGHKNIGELAYVSGLNTEEFYAALCLLLAQKRIQFLESKGLQSESLPSIKPSRTIS